MPAFHKLFLEWADLSAKTMTTPAATAAEVAAANATTGAMLVTNNSTARIADFIDFGDWVLGKGHNVTQTIWGLANRAVITHLILVLTEAYLTEMSHRQRRRRVWGWMMPFYVPDEEEEIRDHGGDHDYGQRTAFC